MRHEESNYRIQSPLLLENWSPYELHASWIDLTLSESVFPKYYGFDVLNLTHCSQETMEQEQWFRITHILPPICPSYNHNNHQSLDILEIDTIEWKYTLCRGALSISPYKILNLLIWGVHRRVKYSPYDIVHAIRFDIPVKYVILMHVIDGLQQLIHITFYLILFQWHFLSYP